MEKRLLRIEELAIYISVQPKTIRNWLSAGIRIPKDAIVRGVAGVRFDKKVIDRWIDSNKESPLIFELD